MAIDYLAIERVLSSTRYAVSCARQTDGMIEYKIERLQDVVLSLLKLSEALLKVLMEKELENGEV